MNTSVNYERDLTILETIEKDPDTSQAFLANQLGVAVGTINWHLKRLIAKGYVKVKRAQRRKLKYIITPEGLTLRARLTVDFIQSSFELYRLVRNRSIEAVRKLEEIFRLTCGEFLIEIDNQDDLPFVEIRGLKIITEIDKSEN
ncbi:MAG: winged helix-turn-helix transcriptional regulator [Anaerolineaceae bacterium]|nr:winged helix-turn-helix transcriptional regulator [Anaerolineaceae bacterium]